HRVICDTNIQASVPVVVRKGDSQAFPWFRETNSLRDLSKVSVAVVVIHERGCWREKLGIAVRPEARLVGTAPDIAKIPFHVTQDNQIQQSIIVQVHPRRAAGPSATTDTSLLRDVGKRTVAIVVIKPVAAICSHKQIGIAVVVVIAYDHAHAVARSFEPRFFRDVLEASVTLLVVQAIPDLLAVFPRN